MSKRLFIALITLILCASFIGSILGGQPVSDSGPRYFGEVSEIPPTIDNAGVLYTKTDGYLYYKDAAGVEVQLGATASTSTPVTSETLGDNIVTDPSIEAWTDATTPVNYTVFSMGAGATVVREDVVVHTGDHSAKLIISNDGLAPGVMGRLLSGLTVGDHYEIGGMGKIGNCDLVQLVILDDVPESATLQWDSDTNDFVAYPGDGHHETLADSEGDWDDGSADYVPVPASGKLFIGGIAVSIEHTPNAYGYIDDVYIKKVTRSTTATKNIGFPQTLSITTGIDLTNVGQSPILLYTVPTGYSLFMYGGHIVSEESETINTAGAYSIGTNSPSYDNILWAGERFPIVTGEKTTISEMSGEGEDKNEYMPVAGDKIYFKLKTAWDADEAKATVYMFGALIAN